jgi:hypothetical protein
LVVPADFFVAMGFYKAKKLIINLFPLPMIYVWLGFKV